MTVTGAISEPYLVSICRNLPSARSLHERLLGVALHREVSEAERGGGGRLVQQRRVRCAPGQGEGEGRAKGPWLGLELVGGLAKKRARGRARG